MYYMKVLSRVIKQLKKIDQPVVQAPLVCTAGTGMTGISHYTRLGTLFLWASIHLALKWVCNTAHYIRML